MAYVQRASPSRCRRCFKQVWRAAKKLPAKECSSPRRRSPRHATSDSVWVQTPARNGSVEVRHGRTRMFQIFSECFPFVSVFLEALNVGHHVVRAGSPR